MEAAQGEVAKLPPGAVVVAAMKFTGGTARELINWQKREGYKFPVIAIVDNFNPSDILSVMRDGGAVDVIQRPAIGKQLVETVRKYIKNVGTATADELLIHRPSKEFERIEKEITRIASTDANVIIFGESGMGKEQIAREIFRQSNRTDKPLIVIEAGGAALVGEHKPDSEKSEMYNRIGDMILDDLCRGWLYKLENEDHINGSLKTIKSQSPGALSHWRELSFKCGNMRLVIYPDGGLANGWYIDTITASMRYTPENTDTNTVIPLRREQVIKFDVDLEY